MGREHRAAERFEEGYQCSAAVLSAFAEDYGLSEELALRVAGALGGGMARTGGICGAASGGLMAIGLKYGMVDGSDVAGKEECYAAGREFLVSFGVQQGSMQCRELLGIDISTSAGMQAAREQGLFRTICPGIVRNAVRLAEQIIDEAGS